jgi:hypothetical protein
MKDMNANDVEGRGAHAGRLGAKSMGLTVVEG